MDTLYSFFLVVLILIRQQFLCSFCVPQHGIYLTILYITQKSNRVCFYRSIFLSCKTAHEYSALITYRIRHFQCQRTQAVGLCNKPRRTLYIQHSFLCCSLRDNSTVNVVYIVIVFATSIDLYSFQSIFLADNVLQSIGQVETHNQFS